MCPTFEGTNMSTNTVNRIELGRSITPSPGGIEWAREQGISASNAAAFELILAHDLGRLYRKAFVILRNREDAEDALQEALWKAFCRLSSFEGRSALLTWVTSIVINSAIMILRRRRSHFELSLDEMMESQPEALALHAADKRPDPEQTCAASEFIQATENQLIRLSDCEQAAFHHFVIKGHSMKESASTLGVSVATFKSRICRTRGKLARGMHHSRNKARANRLMGDVVHDAEFQ
jgi:RNA polymerase sigma-70 factor, ECF subfamily